MKNDTQVIAQYAVNLDSTVGGEVEAREVAQTVMAAQKEYDKMFDLPEAHVGEIVKALEDVQEYARRKIEGVGVHLGLSDPQVCGLLINVGYGIGLEIIDAMRQRCHPVQRAVYFGTLLRMMQRDSVVATLHESIQSGLISESDAGVMLHCHAYVDENPLKLAKDAKQATDAEKAILGMSDDDTRGSMLKVVSALAGLTEQVEDPEAKAVLTKRLNGLRDRLGLHEDSAMGEITTKLNKDGEVPTEVLETIANATGGRVSVDRLRRAIKQATPLRGEDGRVVVIKLDEEENND